jgi:hypothetical protein
MEEQVRAAVLATYGQGLYPDMHELNTGDAYPNTDTQYLYTMPPVPSAVPTSSTDTSASTCSESLPLSQVDETETAPPVDQQQQYTKEQWRAWYQYYYGYVPQGLEEEDKSQPTATGPESVPQSPPARSQLEERQKKRPKAKKGTRKNKIKKNK